MTEQRHSVAEILDQAEEIAASVDAASQPVAAARLPLLVQATRVKLGRSEDVSGIAQQEVTFRFSLLLHIADGSAVRVPRVVGRVVRATVDELADRAHEKVTGLALWAGMTRVESGYDALPEPYQTIAVERVLRAGLPVIPGAALAWVADMLPPGPGRDTALNTLVQSRCPSDGTSSPEAWLPILRHVGSPLVRAQAMLELAIQARNDADMTELSMRAQEAYERLSPGDVVWRGRPAAMFGGVVARSDEALSERLVAHAWDTLGGLLNPGDRTRAYQALLMAESQRGLAQWRAALDALATDAPLKAEPKRWADLVFDAAGLSRFLRGSAEDRSAALGPVRELIERITFPDVKALVFAAFAEACSWTTDRQAAEAFEEVRAALRMTQDSHARATILPRVARLCGQADLAGARDMIGLGRTAHEKVMWLLGLAEIAAGLRR